MSLQFMFGCLSVSFRTIKEKKQVCFLLFIQNVQVVIRWPADTGKLKRKPSLTKTLTRLHNLMPIFIQPAQGVGPLLACQRNGI